MREYKLLNRNVMTFAHQRNAEHTSLKNFMNAHKTTKQHRQTKSTQIKTKWGSQKWRRHKISKKINLLGSLRFGLIFLTDTLFAFIQSPQASESETKRNIHSCCSRTDLTCHAISTEYYRFFMLTECSSNHFMVPLESFIIFISAGIEVNSFFFRLMPA